MTRREPTARERELVEKLLPLLAQNVTMARAAQEMGVRYDVLKQAVSRCRAAGDKRLPPLRRPAAADNLGSDLVVSRNPDEEIEAAARLIDRVATQPDDAATLRAMILGRRAGQTTREGTQ